MSEQTEGDQTTQVDLTYGVNKGGTVVRQVLVRRPTWGDMKQVAKMQRNGEPEEAISEFLLQRLASLAPEEIDSMDVADVDTLNRTVAGFMPEETATSSESSSPTSPSSSIGH